MEKTRQELKGQEMDKATQSNGVASSKPSRVDGKIIRKIVSSGTEGQDVQEKEKDEVTTDRMKMTDENIVREIKL